MKKLQGKPRGKGNKLPCSSTFGGLPPFGWYQQFVQDTFQGKPTREAEKSVSEGSPATDADVAPPGRADMASFGPGLRRGLRAQLLLLRKRHDPTHLPPSKVHPNSASQYQGQSQPRVGVNKLGEQSQLAGAVWQPNGNQFFRLEGHLGVLIVLRLAYFGVRNKFDTRSIRPKHLGRHAAASRSAAFSTSREARSSTCSCEQEQPAVKS